MSTRLVVRRIVVTVSLVGGIFLAVENLWAILRPAPQLQISPSTTWITEPLAADGLPDYEAGLLAAVFGILGVLIILIEHGHDH